MLRWFRSPSKDGKKPEEGKRHKVHLGESKNKFYFDEKLKRWRVEGEEEGEEEEAGPPSPPKMSAAAVAFGAPGGGFSHGNGAQSEGISSEGGGLNWSAANPNQDLSRSMTSNDTQRSSANVRRNIRSRYVDAFGNQSVDSAVAGAATTKKAPLLPFAPVPSTGGGLNGSHATASVSMFVPSQVGDEDAQQAGGYASFQPSDPWTETKAAVQQPQQEGEQEAESSPPDPPGVAQQAPLEGVGDPLTLHESVQSAPYYQDQGFDFGPRGDVAPESEWEPQYDMSHGVAVPQQTAHHNDWHEEGGHGDRCGNSEEATLEGGYEVVDGETRAQGEQDDFAHLMQQTKAEEFEGPLTPGDYESSEGSREAAGRHNGDDVGLPVAEQHVVPPGRTDVDHSADCSGELPRQPSLDVYLHSPSSGVQEASPLQQQRPEEDWPPSEKSPDTASAGTRGSQHAPGSSDRGHTPPEKTTLNGDPAAIARDPYIVEGVIRSLVCENQVFRDKVKSLEEEASAQKAEQVELKLQLHCLESDMNDLLVCLGQESSKVSKLVGALNELGVDGGEMLREAEEAILAHPGESGVAQEEVEGKGDKGDDDEASSTSSSLFCDESEAAMSPPPAPPGGHEDEDEESVYETEEADYSMPTLRNSIHL
ncbi:hypothetical protein HOP50_09g56640 [Chloropicon primus]|nr:hypothetical protein HOP50_09g56640 [Chloropicon primus]